MSKRFQIAAIVAVGVVLGSVGIGCLVSVDNDKSSNTHRTDQAVVPSTPSPIRPDEQHAPSSPTSPASSPEMTALVADCEAMFLADTSADTTHRAQSFEQAFAIEKGFPTKESHLKAECHKTVCRLDLEYANAEAEAPITNGIMGPNGLASRIGPMSAGLVVRAESNATGALRGRIWLFSEGSPFKSPPIEGPNPGNTP